MPRLLPLLFLALTLPASAQTAFRLVEGQASEERVHPDEASGLQPDPSRQVSLVTFDRGFRGKVGSLVLLEE